MYGLEGDQLVSKTDVSFSRQATGWCQLLMPLGQSIGIIAPLRLLTGLLFAEEKGFCSMEKTHTWWECMTGLSHSWD